MRRLIVFAAVLANLWALKPALAEGGILQIRNGYFWDPHSVEYFIPRGIAYQTWNPPVGADQTFEQFDYDMTEFKKIYANSVRAEFVWNEVEKSQGVYDWSKPDHMVAKAEELGFKLFILVGFQYAPTWFSEEGKAVNSRGQRSVVLNYEHPSARAASSNYIYQATHRFRNSAAIGGWILGNEYAYFDLWDTNRQFLGFDTFSQASFRAFLAATYTNDIAGLNSNWGTNYSSFGSVMMPTNYPPDRRSGAYFDLIQWRKKSIGDYVAAGAIAAKLADPNHLRTYSMVGGIYSGNDYLNTCEDATAIVARCAAAGAPLDFWSINNYAWASIGSELRTADYGIAKYRQQSGLPVMVSETGHSSTESLFDGAPARQAKAIPSQMWEAVLSGAIGTHIFHWSDREMFGGPFLRERGFGFVQQNRLIKDPVYWTVLAMFRQMDNINLDHLVGGSTDPRPDVQYFWSLKGDVVWPRANQENAMLWGALRRAGYQPALLDDAHFQRRDYTNAAALILSRCMNMDPLDLEKIRTNVIPAGIHVYADTDFPAQYDAYGRANPNWNTQISTLFGLDVSNAYPGFDSAGIAEVAYDNVSFTGLANLGAITPGYSAHMGTWKIWHNVHALSGTTIATHRGDNDSQPPMPALQIKNLGPAKTAINTFALSDTYEGYPDQDRERLWDIRYDWLRAVFRTHFGITPVVDLSGTGSPYVLPDYRICRNGSILIALLNEHTNTASITLSSPSLLSGKTVENLTTGGIVETNSDGVLSLTMAGDDYVLLYAYPTAGGTDQSLVNSNLNKLWFQAAPTAIWPSLTTNQVTIGYDTSDTNLKVAVSLERVLAPNKVYASSSAVSISGKGAQTLALPVPDADPNDINYISSHDGGKYILHAWLEKAGARLSEVTLPVRLLWPVHPLSPLPTVVAGNTYPITMEWQELPSYDPREYPTPLNRADLWDPFAGNFQFYDIILELRNAAGLVAFDHFLTSAATDQRTFSITVPAGATGPFKWQAYLRSAPGTSVDVFDGFENRGPGADVRYTSPWISYVYAEFNNAIHLDEGVGQLGTEGRQAAFLVVSNPASPGSFSGFGFTYTYTNEWALPSDFRQWTNWSFSLDFMEEQRLPCIVELQVKDSFGGLINFTNAYTPGTDGWQRVFATLDRFTTPSYSTPFKFLHVNQIVVNIQMLQKGPVIYAGFFDRIRFDGQEKSQGTLTGVEVIDSFEDRARGNDASLIAPWITYPYSESNNVGIAAQGIHPQASDGEQSAFIVVPNPLKPGNYSGFGMYYTFAVPWSLPVNTQLWSNYSFSFDFKEDNRYRCQLELQIKSANDRWMSFFKGYPQTTNAWETARATLNDFFTPDGFGPFDFTHIEALAINVQMISKNVTYVASIDNIRFEGPKTPLPPDFGFGAYFSDNDSLLDSDHDGIPDVYETGTGIYVSPTNTGTNPHNRDSDGDGISDGDELIAGTNPNSAIDLLRISDVHRDGSGHVVLSWAGHPNRVYGVYYLDTELVSGASFLPLGTFTNLTTATSVTMHVTDPSSSPRRFYRVTARAP